MKSILTVQDLALNGARPAFKEPLHVGQPNLGSQERFSQFVNDIYSRKWLTNDGPLLKELEMHVARIHGVKHCVAMANGTVALEIAIRALNLKGEVIIPSYTFVATAHALNWQEITPVFADIDPATHNIDPDSVRRMITPRTSGVIGVHLWGRSAPTEALEKLAKEFGLRLLFDSAHAFGCTNGGKKIGGFGDCEVLSFHATKVFNTFEGGAVLTNNDELAEKMRLMRNFGFAGEDNVIHSGTNGKMNEVCAAMGLTNLESLQSTIAVNKRNHEAYECALRRIEGIQLVQYDPVETNNYQYVVVEVDEHLPATRDGILKALRAENVLARRYFWPGCHRMMPYRELFPHAGLLLKNTEEVARKVLVLPTGSSVEEETIETIARIIELASRSATRSEAS